MIIKSRLQVETADCETLFFPEGVKKGTKCFRVDQGKLYEYTGTEWQERPVPVGKFWFNPNTRVMMVYRRKNGWKPILSLQRDT